MKRTVMGLVDSFEGARDLIDDLIDNGYSRDDIGIIAKEPEGRTAEDREKISDAQISGVAKGVGIGAAAGGIAGVVIGIAAFTLPGIGAVLAAGPIAAGLAGAGLGAVTGGVYGAIRNLGVPEEEAQYYAEGVRRGGVLVVVEVDEEDAERAEEIMTRDGVVDINERAREWKVAGWEIPRPGREPGEEHSDRPSPH